MQCEYICQWRLLQYCKLDSAWFTIPRGYIHTGSSRFYDLRSIPADTNKHALITCKPCIFADTVGPQFGPVRAVFVGVHSKLFGRPTLRSVRTADVAALSARIDALPDKFFIEVFGDKGVGKMTIVETATAHRFGVVHMTVDAR